jgi:5-hydroxyisourate hydrolase
MPSLSTHILDSAGGGPRPAVLVELHDSSGVKVGSGWSDERGRVEDLAAEVATGTYTLTWTVDGDFISSVSATVRLTDERRYHVPLLASGFSATVYLGA